MVREDAIHQILIFVILRVAYEITAKYTWKNGSECDSITVELMNLA